MSLFEFISVFLRETITVTPHGPRWGPLLHEGSEQRLNIRNNGELKSTIKVRFTSLAPVAKIPPLNGPGIFGGNEKRV